jgi:uncharacterized protein
MIDRRVELILAERALDELARVLTVKLGLDAERVLNVTTLLNEIAATSVPAPSTAPEPITGDPDDDLILECAVHAEAQIVVSGDRRHLLPVGEHRGVRVITPQQLLAELANP